MLNFSGLLAGRVPVDSSNLASVGYNPWTGVLEIEFHGGRVYQYFGVPLPIYAGLMGAESHGKFFHAYVRNSFQFRRIQ
jgi:hypothetical protein